MAYQPSDEILKKYADVLIKFALWGGKGINKGDVVCLNVPECAKPMLIHLQTAVLEAGGHCIIRFLPNGISKNFFDNASDEQLTWMPQDYMLERLNTCTHFVSIIAEADKHELSGVPGAKIMEQSKSAKFYKDAFMTKVDKDKASWTLAMYATEAMASEVGMSLEEYWDQIIEACFLKEDDPIAKWTEVNGMIEDYKDKLNALDMQWVHIEGEDADLKVQLGSDRQWLGGRGCNIPSFELFISPDWRGTEGWINFNQPLYRYGQLIKGVRLEFKDGLVVKAEADENEDMLKEMIATENANKIGEYSLTDKRFSRITKFMGETLFDENVGGEFGNTHLAVGSAYRESYRGNPADVTEEQWEELGFNNSVVHTDIVSTTDRKVTATLGDGSEVVIYENGMFTL